MAVIAKQPPPDSAVSRRSGVCRSAAGRYSPEDLPRLRASDAAYIKLKRLIQTGDYPPNSLIDETVAAQELGTSRTPVREALLRLQSEGFVVISRGKGIRVLPLSVTDLREIYQVITGLEVVAVSLLAAGPASRKKLDSLFRATREMYDALAKHDMEAWGEADEVFHRELVRLSGNHRLYTVCCQLRDVAKRGHVIAVRMQTPDYKRRSIENHQKLIEFILQHKPDDAWEHHYKQRLRGEEGLVSLIEHYDLKTL